MRNLKRALSLTLASVMLLGMMVVGSSAAAGYDDVSETDNVEAIEVLQAIEVMVGDERGFGPERPVNRAEMAVVMGKLLSLDYNYYSTSCPFNDVYDWAQGWVGACAANGIVSGRGEGVYDPGATVTAVEAASMLMRALGYFQYSNDYADGFEVSTVRQGTIIGIFDGVGSSATAPMTRNQVAQMVLNALQSDVVEPDGNTTTFLNPDGTVLATTGKVNYVSVTRDEPFATAISRTQATSVGSQNSGWIVELGERLYNGDLKLYDTVNTTDDFERPSRTWEYDGKEIGTYMKKENIREEYTTAVTARTLYDLLGRTILQEYDFNYYVDGVLAEGSAATVLSRQTNDYGATGRGVLTQVFVDVENETIDITSINTYLAQAAMNYNSTTESVSLNVFSDALRTGTDPNYVYDTYNATKNVSKVDVPEIEGLEQDDYILVNVSGKDNNATYVVDNLTNLINLSNYDVVAAYDVEVLTDSTLTKFSKRSSDSDINSNSNQALFSSVVTGGTEYRSSAKAYYSDDVLDLYDNDLLVGKTYNIYLDRYGYAIGIDLFEGDNNYVFITGFDPSGSNIAYGNAAAAAIFADGTQDVITVNVKATNENIDRVDGLEADGITRVAPGDPNFQSYFEKWGSDDAMNGSPYALNRWYTYTVNANGVYTLQPATRMITTEVVDDDYTNGEFIIKTNSVRIDEKASLADDTYTATTVQGDGMNGWAAGKADTRVFGNDNSVYIVIDPDDMEVVDKSTSKKVITEVSGVYTGVQNVEINVETVDDASTGKDGGTGGITGTALYDSIYTVYDKNNYIIASVVIGEARGDNANYAYILTAATSEEVVADGGTVWTFDAIVDGVRTTLTTNSKFTSVVNKLEPGHIQELRFSGDYVSSVSTPTDKDKYYDYTDATTARIDEEEIYDVGHRPANPANGNYDCVTSGHVDVAANDGSNYIDFTSHAGHLTKVIDNTTGEYVYEADDLRIDGNTMYFRREDVTGSISGGGSYDYDADYGLALAPDAKGVIIHQVDGSWKVLDNYTVAQAISELKDPVDSTVKKEFEGRIVAALNSQGAAKWVVFISENGVTTPGGGSVNNQYVIHVNRNLAGAEYTSVDVTVTGNGPWDVIALGGSDLNIPGWTPSVPALIVNRESGKREYTVSLPYEKASAKIVTFNVNGATSGSNSTVMENGAGTGVETPAAPSRTNYVFLGWGETPNATTTVLAGDDYFPASNCTLYAVWGKTVNFTLEATSSGGATGITGTYAPASLSETVYNGGVVLPDVGAADGLSNKTGWTLIGWATTQANAQAGNADAGAPGARYTGFTAGDTLYSVWSQPYTLTYDINGGSGTVPTADDQSAVGAAITLPGIGSMTAPANKSFAGWTTTADDASTKVTSPVTPTADDTLYALWLDTRATATAGAAKGASASAGLTVTSSATVTAPAAGSTTGTITVTISGTVANGDTITVTVTGTNDATVTNSPVTLTYSTTDGSWSADHSVTVKSQDEATTYTFNVEVTGP